MYKDNILEKVSSNDDTLMKLFSGYPTYTSQEILDELVQAFPDYSDQFTDFYNKEFNTSPGLR